MIPSPNSPPPFTREGRGRGRGLDDTFRRVSINGVNVDAASEWDVIARVDAFVSTGTPHQIMTANPLMIVAAEKDPALAEAFRSAHLVVPDSAGVIWAARRKGVVLQKISGVDLMVTLCGRAAERGWRVYFLGAAPGVAEKAAGALTARFPGLIIAGVRHGYGLNEEAVRDVSMASPDLLFVALSTPFQDGWIHRRLTNLNAKVAMGVGGSFDVISGNLRRAPAWMRARGLEWLFRLLQEPKRAFRMVGLLTFVWQTYRRYEFPNTRA